MSQRLTTRWLCYLLALSASPFWNPVRSVTVRTPPHHPTTVQAQAKFFQYRHLPTSEDFDQGHRLGSERHFTERHERSRPSAGLFSAKVRWGDKKGGYGEHYWDLNHAGHAGNHGDDGYGGDSDDGSYHVRDSPSDNYDDGPSNGHSSYSNDDYHPDSSSYEENERIKRAHPRAKAEKKSPKEYNEEDTDQRPTLRKHKIKKVEQLEAAPSHKVEEYSEEDAEPEVYKKVPKKRQQQQRHREHQDKTEQQDYQPKEEKNQVVLVVKEKDDAPEQNQYTQQQPELNQYVNYEDGAGVRQHQQQEVSASVPRLFLEHSTGRVVDRATGQAYILQPILNNNY